MTKIDFTKWTELFKSEIESANERIEADFNNAFEWGYIEKRYEAEYKLQIISYFDADTPLEEFVNQIEREIFKRLPLSTSTSESSNRAEVLKLNALLYLKSNCNWYSL